MCNTRKKGPQGNIFDFFLLETLENGILNMKFNPQMTTIRTFFPKIRLLFPISEKEQGRSSPSLYSSYAPDNGVCSCRSTCKLNVEPNLMNEICSQKKSNPSQHFYGSILQHFSQTIIHHHHHHLHHHHHPHFNYKISDAVVKRLLVLHSFIQLSLSSGFAQVQILLAVCPRFAMVRISDNGSGWKQSYMVNHTTKRLITIIIIIIIITLIKQLFAMLQLRSMRKVLEVHFIARLNSTFNDKIESDLLHLVEIGIT